jgi:1,2-diacylglycerol 3-alpha-glucosyltransferase
MKIAFFTDSWLPNVDGVVTSLVNYRGELEKNGHQVWVFTTGKFLPTNRLPKDAHVVRYPAVPFPPYPQYRIALFPYGSAATVARHGIDLVHCHAQASMGPPAIVTAKALQKPLVGTYHTMIPQGVKLVAKDPISQRVAENVTWRAIKAFYKPFDLVTAPSQAAVDSLRENGVKTPTVVVPNGVDTHLFNPRASGASVREALKLQKGEKVILAAGRVSFEKNFDDLVKALPNVLKETPARLVIAGKGPAERDVRNTVRRLGLEKHVTFVGFLTKTHLAQYYRACDVFATASTFETQGLTVLEAMACEKPVVGCDYLAIPEAIKDNRNGFLFPAHDTDACAHQLAKVLTASRPKYRAWSENARKTALTCSIPNATARLLKAYQQVLHR